MRATVCCLLAGCLLPGRLAIAQDDQTPRWTITFNAGIAPDRDIWTIDRQPLRFAPEVDTATIQRSTGTSLVLEALVARRLTRRVAVALEWSYLSLPLRTRCAMVYRDPNGGFYDGWCAAPDDARPGTNTSFLVAGAVSGQLAPQSVASPYLSTGVGLLTHHLSTVAAPNNPPRIGNPPVIVDPSPDRTSWLVDLRIGVTWRIGPARRIRLEGRDAITRLQRPTGPADAAGRVGTAMRTLHLFAFTAGMDWVLDRSARQF
jgi:hypothetical protein